MDVFADLEAELAQLEAMLDGLSPEQWRAPSAAPGWSVADVVLHLAQTEEAIPLSAGSHEHAGWRDDAVRVDDLVERWVKGEDLDPLTVFERWRTAHRAAVATLRTADPQRRLAWAAAPLKPATLATTRIAEHWAHAQDIAVPLGLVYPDTDRLCHVAWLAHGTLPYAFGLERLDPVPVFVELLAPSGAAWAFGDPTAPTRVQGSASDFCRVGARRLLPADSGLVATGPGCDDVLRLLRNYAF